MPPLWIVAVQAMVPSVLHEISTLVMTGQTRQDGEGVLVGVTAGVLVGVGQSAGVKVNCIRR